MAWIRRANKWRWLTSHDAPMMPLAVVIVGLAFCAVLWLSWRTFIRMVDTHAARYFDLLERAKTPPHGTSPDEPVPDDIVAHVMATRHATWAQEHELAFAREKYREYGDWAPVRVLLGVNTAPEDPE